MNATLQQYCDDKRVVQLHVLQATLKYWILVVGLVLQLPAGPVQLEAVGQLQEPAWRNY